MSDPKKYTVGWICAIKTEYVAARAFLDEEHEQAESVSQNDNNSYTLGRIGPHSVVVAVLPDGEYGNNSAAAVARDMMHSFPNVRIGLMVGIGGGAPSSSHDIRLGDIVVSSPGGGTGGVWQYDYGKTIQDQEFHRTGFLNQPPTSLRTAVVNLKATHELEGHGIKAAIEHAFQKKPRLKGKYGRPDGASDRLFKSSCVHPKKSGISCEDTCNSDPSNIVVRRQRDEEEDDPAVHYGLIASANQLMKNAIVRDTLAREHNVLCFEMEAAGLMNHFPCLVIRGICDYADSHKNKQWQEYAAMTAAAYTKDLLTHIAPKRVEAEKKLGEALANIDKKVDHVVASLDDSHTVHMEYRKRDWLSPPDPSIIFNKSVAQHHPETGQWFFRSPMFTDWVMGKTSFLWLHGIPGCGKTILSSTIIKKLKDRKRNDQVVLYYFFTFSNKSMQEYEGMIRSLIAQMVAARIEGSQKYVDQLYAACANGAQQPSLRKLLDTLQDMLRGAGHVYIIVDALDECENRGNGLFQGIKELQLIPETRLLVTGRTEQDIKASISAWAREEDMISIQSDLVADDIRAYIHTRVREHDGLSRWRSRPRIQEEIESTLFEKADGMFRWVSCQLDALERCLDVPTLRQALATLPKTLDETYVRILQRIPQEHQRYACRILQFITYSEEPLSMEELVDTIAVFPEKRPGFVREDRMPIPEEMLLYCSSLVTRVDDDSGSSIQIRLAHFSVQEYLTSDRLHEDIAKLLEERSAKTSIVKVCLTYLLSVDCGSHEEFPLAKFAARTWPLHAAGTSLRDDTIHELIVELLESELPLASHFISLPYYRSDENCSSVGCATVLGLSRVVRDLLNGNASESYTDEELYDALCISARYGYEDIGRHLFDHGIKLDAHNSGQSALGVAATYGHNGVIRLLLANGADVMAVDHSEEMALHIAAWNGQVDTVSFLLSEGADIEAVNYDRRTALHLAAQYDHTDTVSLLLSEGANIEAVNNGRRTALHLAAQNDHMDTVSLLLSEGANIDAVDDVRKTALHYVAERSFIDVGSLLLSKGADHSIADIYGETPLHCAAERNYLGTTKILVSQGASLDAVDRHGRTPMGCAKRPLSGPFKYGTCVETIKYFEVVMKEREVAAKAGSSQA